MLARNDITRLGRESMCMSFAGGMEKPGQSDDSFHRRVQVIPVTFTLLKRQQLLLFTRFILTEISWTQLTTFMLTAVEHTSTWAYPVS